MKKRFLLISLLVVVLALAGIGAAFATGMNFSNVGALSLGIQNIPQINTDYVGYHLSSSQGTGVVVDGVYLSLDTSIAPNNAFSVSLRSAGGSELCYYAANNLTMDASEIRLFNLTTDTGNLPTADQVFKVKVTVAQNSQYN